MVEIDFVAAVKTHSEGRPEEESAEFVFGATPAASIQALIDSLGESIPEGGFVDVGSGHGGAVISALEHRGDFTFGHGIEAVAASVEAANGLVPEEIKDKVSFAAGNAASDIDAEKLSTAAVVYWVATHCNEATRQGVVDQLAASLTTGALVVSVTHPSFKGNAAFEVVSETKVELHCGACAAFVFKKLEVVPQEPVEEA